MTAENKQKYDGEAAYDTIPSSITFTVSKIGGGGSSLTFTCTKGGSYVQKNNTTSGGTTTHFAFKYLNDGTLQGRCWDTSGGTHSNFYFDISTTGERVTWDKAIPKNAMTDMFKVVIHHASTYEWRNI